ncbi:MAG: hypothetical protein IAG13_21390 [Deltaproteobacteria bacterium]|nr:hypothetical protein [Nannocystaceae bacterium]
MHRKLALLTIAAAIPGCYDPASADPTEITTNDESGTSDGTVTGASDPTNPSSPSTTNPSGPDTSSESGDAVCGDGEVEGDEVCDDGVNDGAYGGCASDCSALADRCGDEAVNGPEVCDDGVNDGAYGSCTDDCSAQGPHCGDLEVNGPEGCDLGKGNVNGTGCNADCVISGSLLGTYDLGGLSFCEGSFITEPAFRDNGNTVVAATGYCDDDSVALVELAPDVTEVAVFDDLLLPQTPTYQGTTLGDDWLLAAYGCTYVIDANGELTELCGGRTAGQNGLEAAADDVGYVALDYDALSLYAAAPAVGDAPAWTQAPPDNDYYDYYFNAATFGASGSVVVAGYIYYSAASDQWGYLARYTAAGNLVNDYSDTSVDGFYAVEHAPDGSVLAISGYPNYTATLFDSGLSNPQVITAPGADNQMSAAFDSTNALVMLFHESVGNTYQLVKRAADGTQLWAYPIVSVSYSKRIAVDANDAIWVADVVYMDDGPHLVVQKFAP